MVMCQIAKEVVMRYRKSIYNVIIEKLENGNDLIYNTYSGVYGIMDIKTQDVYENIESFSSEHVCDEEVIKNINVMLQAGYIIDAEKNELVNIKLERSMNRHQRKTLALTIAPTMDCNMCCPYCYEENRNIIMSKEMQEGLINFLKVTLAANEQLKNVHVSWFGGEPLMQKEIIYSLSRRIIEACNELNVHYSANIITNGVLMDAQTARQLVDECKVRQAQITIDGMRERHNKRRILISGEDSFGIIMKNIDECKDIIPINVRVNTDKENVDEIEMLTDYFLEEKSWTDNPSFYLAPVHLDFGTCDSSNNAICVQGEEFGEINIKAIKASYDANRESVVNMFFPRRKFIFCGGEGVLNYVVDPEGYLYTCYRQIGKKEHSTGHISKPFIITEEYGKWLLSDIHGKCENCEYLPMCMGGCALYRINGGEPECFRTYYTYKDLLKLAYQDYLHQKSKSESIAGN